MRPSPATDAASLIRLSLTAALVACAGGCLVVQAVVDRVAVPLPLPDDPPIALPPTQTPWLVVLEKTASYRHDDAIEAARPHFSRFAAEAGLSFHATQSAGVATDEALADVRVVVLSHANGDLFSTAQRAALLAWLHSGGGLFLLHGAVGDFHPAWAAFADDVVGARFVGHTVPPLVRALVRVQGVAHPVAYALPPAFWVEDEIYAFAHPPTGEGTVILARADTATYRPEGLLGLWEQRRPEGQPLVWSRRVGRGRVFVCALGHNPALYDDETFGALLRAGLWDVSGQAPPLR
jgi:uncharacterized protein